MKPQLQQHVDVARVTEVVKTQRCPPLDERAVKTLETSLLVLGERHKSLLVLRLVLCLRLVPSLHAELAVTPQAVVCVRLQTP